MLIPKSTFIKVLIGEQAVDKGIIDTGETVVFGVYDQIGLLSIITEETANMRVLDFLKEEVTSHEGTSMAEAPQTARNLLTQFDFPRRRWNDR